MIIYCIMLCMTKLIKVALSLILAVTVWLFTPIETAFAEGAKYAVADKKNLAYLCSEKNSSTAIFAIPYTYCVEIISSDGEWYYVKYAADEGAYRALYGYCLRENLTPVTTLPERVYLDKQVAVTFTQQNNPQTLPSLTEITVNAAYYGVFYQADVAYSYVLYGSTFGYILGANDDYPLNSFATAGTNTPSSPSSATAKESGASAKIIIACVLCALAATVLILLYFTGKRKKLFQPKN